MTKINSEATFQNITAIFSLLPFYQVDGLNMCKITQHFILDKL